MRFRFIESSNLLPGITLRARPGLLRLARRQAA